MTEPSDGGAGGPAVPASPATPAAPVVIPPEQLPKLSLDLLSTIHAAQNAHGLRRTFPDYQRYRRFCASKLRRLRRNARFTCGKKKFTWHVLTPAMVKNERYLVIALVNAERAWAYFLELQREQEAVKDDNSRIKFHALKRLRKAAQWAAKLKELCDVRCDERTILEATGYHLWMRGLLLRELGKWAEAGEALQKAFVIFEGLSKVGVAATRAIAKGRAENIQPLVAYCAYRGGVDVASFGAQPAQPDTSAAPGPVVNLLDKYLVTSLRAEAEQTTIELEGGRRCSVDPQSPLGELIVQCRFRGLEAAGAGGKEESALTMLVRQCKSAEDWLVLSANTMARASEHRAPPPDSAAAGARGKQQQQHVVTEADAAIVRDWAQAQQSAARNRRNELLVDVAVVRCVLDTRSSSGAPSVAASDLLSANPHWRLLVDGAKRTEDADSFVSQSNQWLGATALTWLAVARMVDQLTSALLADNSAVDEQGRRAQAAVVLEYRAVRSFFLSLHLCELQRWAEAIALGVKAMQSLNESLALGNKAGVARWSDVTAHLLRMERVRGNASLLKDEPQSSLESQQGASDAHEEDRYVVVVPGKVALFDLAGTEVSRYPNLDHRLKKKGFLSSWWG